MDKNKICLVDIIYNAVEKGVISRTNDLKSEYENLLNILPISRDIDWINRIITATYFKPNTVTEQDDSINYIAEIINRMNSELDSLLITTYSQMEAMLLLKIRELNKENEYTEYKKRIPKKVKNTQSELKRRINFIMSYTEMEMSDLDTTLIDIVDNDIRTSRNKVVHNAMKIYTYQDIYSLIGDGMNLELRLHDKINDFIENINALLLFFDRFITLYKKL